MRRSRRPILQRLLDGDESLAWPPEELAAWRQAGGWAGGQAGSDMRAWLTQGGRWEKPQREPLGAMAAASPEDDLLAWVLADSNGMPLSRLFCEQLLVRAKPEHAVLWLSDAQGVELASGLGLSLRDFARLGQLRSAGITDLRFGCVVDEDWLGGNRFHRKPDSRRHVPLPEGVACYAIAATTAAKRSLLADRLIGDGLVPLHSALGHHRDAKRRLDFPKSAQWIAYQTSHMALLNHPEVGAQLRRWLHPDSPA